MEEHMRTDHSLLHACQKGDPTAWRSLLDRYERLVYSIPLNFGLSRSDADDVAQATFAALIRSLDTIADEDRLGAWLATVARRQTWRLVERRRREPATDSQLFGLIATEDTAIDQTETLQWVHQGLTEMEPRCRDLLTALYFSADTPSYGDVATEFGIPVGSIGPTRARCLDKLRTILQKLHPE
jgi:RNA polymerase sigma factor (sigma-70 family)